MTAAENNPIEGTSVAPATFPPTPGRSAMPEWYPELFDAVASHVNVGRTRAIAAVNQELVHTYWSIGKDLLEREELEGWGTKVVTRLSADLRERMPETKGFSPRNLRYMKSFAQAWPDFSMLQQPVAT
ncbi:hypothetical protein GCM10027403_08790 [Arthrobacter tecti]